MEIWKDIKGYEGAYQVSNLGNVKSVIFHEHKVLKPVYNGSVMKVRLHLNKVVTIFKIHNLVYDAFIGDKEIADNCVVKHKNGISTDNRLDNLEAVIGRQSFKIEISTKLEIARDFHFTSMTVKEISKKYNVSAPVPSDCGKLFPKEYFKTIDDNESVILVNKKDYDAALLALEYWGIKNIEYDKIVVEQHVGSSINKK